MTLTSNTFSWCTEQLEFNNAVVGKDSVTMMASSFLPMFYKSMWFVLKNCWDGWKFSRYCGTTDEIKHAWSYHYKKSHIFPTLIDKITQMLNQHKNPDIIDHNYLFNAESFIFVFYVHFEQVSFLIYFLKVNVLCNIKP